MLRTVWRNVWAHKLRLVLSGLAVVLGVAFVSGTLIFTDTLQRTFTDLFTQTASDVELSPASRLDDPRAVDTQGASLPASLVATVQDVPGAAGAEGSVLVDGVFVVGRDGKVLGTAGAPAYGVSWSDSTELSPFRLVPGQGRGPTKAGEVALDSQTAEKGKFSVGDSVRIVTPTTPVTATVTGIFRFGASGNLAGASLTAFDVATAQDLLLEPGRFTAISVKADPGVSQDELAAQVTAAIPAAERPSVKVTTGAQAADESASQIREALNFINIFLLVFAGIALLVGSFIILNTFTMLVAQRARELALLRALGASRRQVTLAVMGEALLVGVVGSLLGLALGLLLAQGLQRLISTLGGDVPTGSLILEPRTVAVGLLVGVLVTLAAAYLPARRAAKVPPVAAMRDEVSVPQRSLRLRSGIGIGVLVIALAVLTLGLTRTGSSGASLVGLGAFGLFVAIVTLAPLLAGPAIAVIGAPVRRFGISGRLAVANARRNRRRTASTASALMIGLALVGTIAILGASTTESTSRSIDDVLGADFLLTSQSFRGFTPAAATAVEGVDGVAVVSPVRSVPARIDGSTLEVTAVDPATIEEALSLDVTAGSLADLNDGIMVDTTLADSRGLQVGSVVDVEFSTGPRELPVVAIYTGTLFEGYAVSLTTAEANGGSPLDTIAFVSLEPGASADTVRPGIEQALAPYPTVTLQDQTQFKDQISGQINQLLGVIYGLLALAVVISILGIVNTLALSVVERTREIGLLRAVGMTRRQLRRAIRWESVVIAVFGAVLGVLLGLAFGVSLQRVLRDSGIQVLSIPWALLALFLVVAGLVGVLAALWPARRAAKQDVLEAITTE